MKSIFKKLNTKSIIATGVSVLGAGAGSAIVDWALAKYALIPAEWDEKYVQLGKIAAGAVLGSMVKNQIVKSAADGIATVAAAELTKSLLPVESTNGLPEGMIGRAGVHMGQRNFPRRLPVKGVNGGAPAGMDK